MKTALACLGVSALIAITPAAVIAASGLRGIMHSWRASERMMQAMLSGRTAFDDAVVRDALQNYAADAGDIVARIDARTAAAQDIKRRFATFQTHAQSALGDLGQRAALKADFSRLVSECQSCHDTYN